MSFRPIFIAVVMAFALIVGAFLVNRARPKVETDQPSAAFVRAAGKCGASTAFKLDAPPRTLSTRDMFVPTCATCHMSGLNGQRVTHDPSDRLSYYLADPITKPRPNHDRAQLAMKQLCTQRWSASL
jgi:hypothetical protein